MTVLVAVFGGMVLAGALPAAPADAGRSSTGELAFHPCTKCHPVTLGSDGKPTPPLPNGFEKHTITLEVHDTLGTDEKACLMCHDDPKRNPGMLIAPDGSLIDITGDVSRVCQRCHAEKYREWTQGVHGKDMEKCTAAGCHDAHTPSWIYVAALPPFLGTGFEVRAVAPHEPFKPFAGPPVAPPVSTPSSMIIVTVIGTLAGAGTLGLILTGRSKR